MAEPWLREIDFGIHPALAQPIFALQQAVEDVERCTAGLTDQQIWSSPSGVTPVGFHMRHMAGSTGRLTTYLRGEALTESQLAELRQEGFPGMAQEELLNRIKNAVDEATAVIQGIDPAELGAARHIGRKLVRTTAIGLAIHIGEHALRHTGQIVSVCQMLRG